MTIWVLAIILLFSTAGLGFRQGAIRAAVSFFGILIAALLCVPLSRLIRPLMKVFNVSDPVVMWILPPLIMFVLISLLVKAGGTLLHQKVDVYYKYKAGELRLALWERLNARLGACVGVLNGAAYLALVSLLIFLLSYWTYQVGNPDTDQKSMRLLNRAGKDLQATGFSKVARSIDWTPKRYYDMADMLGLVYKNSLLEARLASYPGFLDLGLRPEFQELRDRQFIETRQRANQSAVELFNHPRIQAIYNNRELLKSIWNTTAANLEDLKAYLVTGRSPKYDAIQVLGHWRFNVSAAASLARRARPNISASEMQKLKRWMIAAFTRAAMVATPEHQVVVNNLPSPLRLPANPAAPPPSIQNYQGQWKGEGNKYEVSVQNLGELSATIEGDRMTMTGQPLTLVFTKDD